MQQFASYFIPVVLLLTFANGETCSEKVRDCESKIQNSQSNLDSSGSRCEEFLKEASCASEPCVKESPQGEILKEIITNTTRLCAAFKENLKVLDCINKNDESFRECRSYTTAIKETNSVYAKCLLYEQLRCARKKVIQLCSVDTSLLDLEIEKTPDECTSGTEVSGVSFIPSLWKILATTILLVVFLN